MPNFEVEMVRELNQLAVINVEAKDEADAAKKAQSIRESLDWSTTDSNYEVVYAHEVA